MIVYGRRTLYAEVECEFDSRGEAVKRFREMYPDFSVTDCDDAWCVGECVTCGALIWNDEDYDWDDDGNCFHGVCAAAAGVVK